MLKRIAAISFIFLCTAVAWGILGATIFQRTYDSDNSSETRVTSTWGAPQNQSPPTASFDELVPKKEVTTENGRKIETVTQDKVTTALPLEASHINSTSIWNTGRRDCSGTALTKSVWTACIHFITRAIKIRL